MKSLIVKTVAITLAILITVGAGIYLLLATVSPRVLSNAYFKVQNETLSIKYSQKAYEKSNDISDLATLTERCILFGEKDLTISYGVMFINDDNYGEYISSKSQGYHYYIVSSICTAEYERGDKLVAVETAFSNTNEYLSLNPIHKLIILSAQSEDKATLTEIKNRLEIRQDKNELVNQHITLIIELIN